MSKNYEQNKKQSITMLIWVLEQRKCIKLLDKLKILYIDIENIVQNEQG